MGFSPEEVGRMTHWQFMAALAGYRRANDGTKNPKSGGTMTEQRLSELGIEGF